MVEKSSDPVAAWRDMLGEWEKGFNAVANKAMGKEEFARVVGAASNASTAAQGALGDLMGRYLATLNLPSRAELTGISERLQAIEAQLAHMTRLLQVMAGSEAPAGPSAPKPARTRTPTTDAGNVHTPTKDGTATKGKTAKGETAKGETA